MSHLLRPYIPTFLGIYFLWHHVHRYVYFSFSFYKCSHSYINRSFNYPGQSSSFSMFFFIFYILHLFCHHDSFTCTTVHFRRSFGTIRKSNDVFHTLRRSSTLISNSSPLKHHARFSFTTGPFLGSSQFPVFKYMLWSTFVFHVLPRTLFIYSRSPICCILHNSSSPFPTIFF